MAIRKEEEKKVGMKITDNMDGEKKANEKLNMQTADLSDKILVDFLFIITKNKLKNNFILN